MPDDLDRLTAPLREIERLDREYCALIERAEAEPELWLDPEVITIEERIIGGIIQTAWSAHADCCRSMRAASDHETRRRYDRLSLEYLATISNLTETAPNADDKVLDDLRGALAHARALNDGSATARHDHFRAAWTLRAVLGRLRPVSNLDAELAAVQSSLTS